jgi:hypothetical protein
VAIGCLNAWYWLRKEGVSMTTTPDARGEARAMTPSARCWPRCWASRWALGYFGGLWWTVRGAAALAAPGGRCWRRSSCGAPLVLPAFVLLARAGLAAAGARLARLPGGAVRAAGARGRAPRGAHGGSARARATTPAGTPGAAAPRPGGAP